MSVTRLIPANTPSQVNAENIGVQIQSESPSCQVEYSVDGQTFTAYPDTLTDSNNVICNIPRYMYLKFSQDVLITEE